jgi:hypothetical protein
MSTMQAVDAAPGSVRNTWCTAVCDTGARRAAAMSGPQQRAVTGNIDDVIECMADAGTTGLLRARRATMQDRQRWQA